jgi:iturin family lipopeptide synthetase A
MKKQLLTRSTNERKTLAVEELSGKEIAIIGMALKVPGAETLDDFWSNLCRGEEWIGEAPMERMALTGSRTTGNKPPLAGYLTEIDAFDSYFFRIPPKEADMMDPYQRLFLEVAWGAMEDAGYGGDRLKGSRTGVYVGSGHEHEYKQIIGFAHPELLSQSAVGNLPPLIASRISYLMDLKGPSLVVDTACSSSLVAVHLACQALVLRECEMAIAGGIQLMLDLSRPSPKIGIESASSAVKAFDAEADGTVRGEGVGAVLLKPLSRAIADNDPIYAVIKGSASNQDGKSIGITSPNMSAQEQLLISAWKQAGIQPSTLSYIEAHGTGTPIGDPIEIHAIQNAFRAFTDRAQFCAIGSLKPNIGHLYHAAGIAGLIKSALALQREQIPPSLHFKRPNPRINFAESPVYVNSELSEWKRSDEIRRCGVSSFGMSGTNCHVVLEEAPLRTNSGIAGGEPDVPALLTLSARSLTSLHSQIEKYRLYLITSQPYEFRDICYTSNLGRGQYEYRLSVIAHHSRDMREKLAALRYTDFAVVTGNLGAGIWFGGPESGTADAQTVSEQTQCADENSKWERAAALYAEGHGVNWYALYAGQSRKTVSAPTYTFDRHKHWMAGAQSDEEIINDMKNREVRPKMRERAVSDDELRGVTEQLRNIIADVSGYSPAMIHTTKSFMELGMDSILLVNARHAIKEHFGIDIPMRRFFEDLSTAADVGRFIAETGAGMTAQMEKEAEVSGEERTAALEEAAAGTAAEHSVSLVQESGSVAFNSGLESIIHKQLDLMNRQLQIMGTSPGQVGLPTSVSSVYPPAVHTPKQDECASIGLNAKDRPYIPYQRLETIVKSGFTTVQQHFLNSFIARYTEKTRKSQLHTQFYRKVAANNRNVAGFRPYWKDMVYQIVVDHAEGSAITDIDGNKYIDVTMGFGVNLFGHHAPFIDKAVEEALKKGMCIGPVNATAGEVALAIKELTGMERSAFFNSGTEAIMVAARLARAATGRPKIAIFSGSYHGTFDGVLAMSTGTDGTATPIAPGIPSGMIGEVIVLNYNHPDSLHIIKQHANELAAVLVEPVQSRKPDLQPAGFLKELRSLTTKCGIALIFDEVITGFRIHPGGAQAWFGIRADMAVYGKIAGGGLPIGIVSGSSEFLDCIDGGMWTFGDDSVPLQEERRTFVAGTFCQHPLAMNASLAVLRRLQEEGPALQEELNRKTRWLADTLNAFFESEQVPLSIVSFGSLFRVVQKSDAELLYYLLVEKGIYIWEGRNCFLSLSHTMEDIEQIVNAFIDSVRELHEGGFLPPSPPPEGGKRLPERPMSKGETKAIPLNEEQRQLWFVSQMDPDTSEAYAETAVLRLHGSLDVGRLRAAIRQVIGRHEMLRTRFAEDGSLQIIGSAGEADQYYGWYEEETGRYPEDTSRLWKLLPGISDPFNLTSGPLIRFGLLHSGPGEHRFIVRAHHIAADGWSILRIVEEIAGYYSGIGAYNPPAPVPFSAFAEWQRTIPEADIRLARDYWRARLESPFPDLSFPTGGIGHSTARLGKKCCITIGSQLTSELRAAGKRSGASLFMLMLAAYNILLSRLTGSRDITVGIPVSGQLAMGAPHLIGQCVNLLPFASSIPRTARFGDYVSQMRKELLECLEYQHCSYADIVKNLSIAGISLQPPVIRTIFNFDKPSAFYFGDMEAGLESSPSSSIKYPFSLNVLEMEHELVLEWEMGDTLSVSDTALEWIEAYCRLLEEIVSDGGETLALYDVTSAGEPETILPGSGMKQESYAGLTGTVRDDDGVPCLAGVPGQLCLIRADLCDEIPTEMAAVRQGKGGIQILGLMNRLICIGGYRVHLDRIEALLKAIGSSDIAVIPGPEVAGSKLLTAFYEYKDGQQWNEYTGTKYAEKVLPQSLVPAKWYPIEGILPQNEAGETDYERLSGYGKSRESSPEPPASPVQELILRIWQEVLKLKNIGIHDPFILSGGNSLAATIIVAKLEKELGIIMPLNLMFQHPTIATFAAALNGRSKSSRTHIPVAEEAESYPLSPEQRSIFAEERMGGAGTAYNITGLVEVEGSLDIGRMQEAAHKLVQRHEPLRTSFHLEEDGPVQTIHREAHLGIPVHTCSYTAGEAKAQILNAVRPFSLEAAPLLRIEIWLNESQPGAAFLLMDMHHLIADGISATILFEELIRLYSGEDLPEPLLHHKDYSQWLLGRAGAGYMRESEKYWRRKLEGDLPRLAWTTDYPRPPVRSIAGERYAVSLPSGLFKDIRNYTARNGFTLYNYVLSAYYLLLSSYANQEDLVIGTSVSGRVHQDIERVPGMFVHTIPLRHTLKRDQLFSGLLQDVQTETLEAFGHQEYPLERLQISPDTSRGIGQNPWFDTVFLYQHTAVGTRTMQVGHTNFTALEQKSRTAKFDLTLEAVETTDQLTLLLEYSTALFDPLTIEAMGSHLLTILETVSAQPDIHVSDIELLSSLEREQLLHGNNRTTVVYPEDKPVYRLFEEQVLRTPDAVAVSCEGQHFTYAAINDNANRLAARLHNNGISTEVPVGLVMHRSPALVAAILGIWKSGGCYVPIDPVYPKERISYILSDSGTGCVIADGSYAELAEYKGLVIQASEAMADGQIPPENPEQMSGPDNLAYIMYTSGSTGKPKGVMVEHRGLTNYICWADRTYIRGDELAFPLYSSISFDLTVTSMFTPLVSGNRIIVYPEPVESALERIICEGEAGIVKLTPSHLKLLHLYDTRRSGLRRFIVGGEALESSAAAEILKLFGPGTEIYNEYGPTETVVGCMIHQFNPAGKRSQVPVGIPIDNIRLYIADTAGRLQARHLPGELCIAGVGVARGYRNLPELTQERFASGWFGETGSVYRTGDLVRWLPEGIMEYMGRLDDQVKINGFRIETGEIQNLLLEHPLIREAAVIGQPEADGSKRLYAYYTSDNKLTSEQLTAFLSAQLPLYMLPSGYIRLDRLPLSANGKLDIKGLPEAVRGMRHEQEAGLPQNQVETELLDIWRSVLRVSDVRTDDDFIQAGGDSIKAIQIAAQMKKKGYRVDIGDIMRGQTVRRIAQLTLLKQTEQDTEQGPMEGEVPLAPVQRWFFDQSFTDMNHWNQSITLNRPGRFDEALTRQTLERLICHHDALRMTFKQTAGGIRQRCQRKESPAFGFRTGGYSETVDPETIQAGFADRERWIETAHQAINLEHGPLVQVILWRTPEEDALTLIVHHLVTDAVSWRILLDDFYDIYNALENKREPKLPDKTNSYKHYVNMMKQYTSSETAQRELIYWVEQSLRPASQLPRDLATGNGTVRDAEVSVLHFTESATALIKNSALRCGGDIPALLLTAWGYAVSCTGVKDGIWVHLEGHGREALAGHPDYTRTVGWFTSHYPVYLNAAAAAEPAGYAAQLHSELQQLPNKGAGYNAIKYAEENIKTQHKTLNILPELCFNYMGELNDEAYRSLFRVSDLSMHGTESPESERPFPVVLNAIMKDQRLLIEVDYNRHGFGAESMQALLKDFLTGLELLLSSGGEYIVPYTEPQQSRLVSEAELAALHTVSSVDFHKAYPLSPMQESMLFHHLRYPGSPAYFEQCVIRLKGVLDPERMRSCFQTLTDRHDILRTSFVVQGLNRPLQIVAKSWEAAFRIVDIALNQFLEEDLSKRFEVTGEIPVRAALIHTGHNEHILVWSFHHILLDGWSVGLILREWFSLYASKRSHSAHVRPAPAYGDYIEWIEGSERQEAEAYWRAYLSGYGNKNLLPKETGANSTPYCQGELKEALSSKLYKDLSRLSAERSITLNNLFQAAWAVVLQKLNDADDILFGTVVSGRTPEVQDIDQMTGLFINTVPVRVKDGTGSFLELAYRLQREMLDKEPFSYLPLSAVQSAGGGTSIDHVVIFENYPLQLELPERLELVDYEWHAHTNYDFNLVVEPLDGLTIKFVYNHSAFDEGELRFWLASLMAVLEKVTAYPEVSLQDIVLEHLPEEAEDKGQSGSVIEFHF